MRAIKEGQYGHDMKRTDAFQPMTLPSFIWFKVFKGQMALFVSGWPPSKPRLRSSGSKGYSLTILAFSWPDMNGCDNLSPERSASGHVVNSLALCPRRIDLLFIIFLACLQSFYPGNKSILKEMVLS